MEANRSNRKVVFSAVFVAWSLAATMFLTPLRAQTPAGDKIETPQLDFVFEEVVTLAPAMHPGKTPHGERNIVPITGGTFSGPNIKGQVMPGGWDWQLTAGGCTSLKADYMLKTDDGVIINVLNRATMCEGKSAPGGAIMTAPVLEAPVGRYDWLNDGVYIGALKVTTFEGNQAVRIRIFKVH